MSKEMNFFIYLLEKYADKKNKNASDILKEWDKLNITQLIYDMYEKYHTETLENAFEDIDKILESKRN
ncbi:MULTISPECIES: DUF3791 domain-containing protein [Leptotrichia]|jgi:hypothetical protein|nr:MULTISPECIES: DUF3791 domain-containing protein [Leptotrichia]ACV38735.1 hypothetical protein Lebu_0827 [Leptotrichia buccalis C-1013-b]